MCIRVMLPKYETAFETSFTPDVIVDMWKRGKSLDHIFKAVRDSANFTDYYTMTEGVEQYVIKCIYDDSTKKEGAKNNG